MQNRTSLVSITIPDAVTSINSFSFYNCTSIASITIPAAVTSIGSLAFGNMTGLTEVIFNNAAAITTIVNANTFSSSASITQLTYFNTRSLADISKGTEIRTAVLAGSSGALTTYNKSAHDFSLTNKTTFNWTDTVTSPAISGSFVSSAIALASTDYSTDMDVIQDDFGNAVLSTIAFGSDTTSIGNSCFANTTIQSALTIPNTVTAIGANAFESCNIPTVILPTNLTAISASCFVSSAITSITIPNTATSIGASAFATTASMLAITFTAPSTCATISDSAFLGSAITSITIPVSMQTIGDNAFKTTGLTVITIPDSVTSIGAEAFYNCTSLANITLPSNTGFKILSNGVLFGTPISSITIPTSVTSIGNSCFANTTIQSALTIPNTVTAIGANAFDTCVIPSVTLPTNLSAISDGCFVSSSITSITIPDTVLTIGTSAFKSTNSMTDIIFTATSTCTSIGTNAFEESAITSIVIPDSVNVLGVGAFSACSATSITLPATIAAIPSNCFEYGWFESITIPSTVISIGSDGFAWHSVLSSITIPNSVSTIGTNAFKYCANLDAVVFPNNTDFKIIPDNCFSGAGLTNISIPNTVTQIGDYAFSALSNATQIAFEATSICTILGEGAFESCDNVGLVSVALPDSIVSIGVECFSTCTYLTSMTIPAAVTSIGALAFQNMTGLLDVIVNNSSAITTAINANTFTSSSNITQLTYYNSLTKSVLTENDTIRTAILAAASSANTTYNKSSHAFNLSNETTFNWVDPSASPAISGSFVSSSVALDNSDHSDVMDIIIPDFGNAVLSTVTIGSVATSIGANCFVSTTIQSALTIPDTVLTIGINAFDTCTIPSVTLPTNLTAIPNNCFDSSTITSITIPDTVVTIGTSAFEATASMASITFTATSTCADIGASAFLGSAITAITIPNTVTSIGDSALESTTSMTTVAFEAPSTCTNIGARAFFGTIITTIAIPESIETIGTNAFEGSSIASVTLPSTNAEFKIIAANCFLDSALTSVTIPNSVTSFGNYAFSGTPLTEVTFGTGLQTIGQHVFFQASSLTAVVIPDSVSVIGISAFESASVLTSVTLPDNVGFVIIPDDCFKGSDLYSATIPNSVTQVGDSAFSTLSNMSQVVFEATSACTSLGANAFEFCVDTGFVSITLPDALVTVGSSCFSNCTSITSMTIPSAVTAIGALAFESMTGLTEVVVNDASALTVSVNINTFNSSASIDQLVFYKSLAKTSESTEVRNAVIAESTGVTTTYNKSLYTADLSDKTIFNWRQSSVLKGSFVSSASASSLASTDHSVDMVTIVSDFVGSVLYTVSIGSLTTSIAANCFENILIQAGFTFAAGTLVSIGAEAFKNATVPVSFSMPSSVTSIGINAFESSSMAAITLPSSLPLIPARCFLNGSITSITIPNTVSTIGIYAFDGASALASVSFESNSTCTDIYTYAFRGTYMQSITIPVSVTNMETYAFNSTSRLTAVTLSGALTSVPAHCFDGSILESVEIPNSVLSIEDYAFNAISELTSVVFESASICTSIGMYAFGAVSIPSITIPDSVTTIGMHAFDSTASLTDMVLSDTLANISDYAFNNAGLLNVIIPDTVTAIGIGAFGSLSDVQQIEFERPCICTSLGAYAFSNAGINGAGFTTINLPDTRIASIGSDCFSGCTNLATISIPATATEIGTDCFAGCTSLTAITILDQSLLTTLGTTVMGAGFSQAITVTYTTVYNAGELTAKSTELYDQFAVGNETFVFKSSITNIFYIQSLNQSSVLETLATISGYEIPQPSGYATLTGTVALADILQEFTFYTTSTAGNIDEDEGDPTFANWSVNAKLGNTIFSNGTIGDGDSGAIQSAMQGLATKIFGSPDSVDFFSNSNSIVTSYQSAFQACEDSVNANTSSEASFQLLHAMLATNPERFSMMNGGTGLTAVSVGNNVTGPFYDVLVTSNTGIGINAELTVIGNDPGEGSLWNVTYLGVTQSGSFYAVGDSVTFTNGSFTATIASLSHVQVAMLNGTLSESTSFPFVSGDIMRVGYEINPHTDQYTASGTLLSSMPDLIHYKTFMDFVIV